MDEDPNRLRVTAEKCRRLVDAAYGETGGGIAVTDLDGTSLTRIGDSPVFGFHLDSATDSLYVSHRHEIAVVNTATVHWVRAQCRVAIGEVMGASAEVEAPLAHADRRGEGYVLLPALLLLAGEIARARHEDPVPHWARGIAVAEQQGSLLWLGRLQRSLAGVSVPAGASVGLTS